MKRSLSAGSGYLLIDHTDSPGVDSSELPAGFITAEKGELLERDIQQCSHCQRGVVLNPGRVRARASCLKCYHYICDECEKIRIVTNNCVPFKQVLDRAADLLIKFENQLDHPNAVCDINELAKPSNPTTAITEFVL